MAIWKSLASTAVSPLPNGRMTRRCYRVEIALFRGPINRVARTRHEAVQEVRETVVHELGHYFGLSDDEMPH